MVQSEDIMEVEIDPEEVTEDSVAEMRQMDAIKDEEVEKFKTYVDLTQTTAEVDPEYTAPSSILNDKLETVTSAVHSGVSKLKTGKDVAVTWTKHILSSMAGATAYGRITNLDVKRLYHSTYIYFTIESDTEEDIDMSLKTDSTEFATLLEYHNADNAKELDQKPIVQNIDCNSVNTPEYYLPQDISLLGRLRYKLLGASATLSEKLSVTENPVFFSIIFGFISFVVGVVGFLLGGFASILINGRGFMFNVVIPILVPVVLSIFGIGVGFILLHVLQVGLKKMYSYLNTKASVISEMSSDR